MSDTKRPQPGQHKPHQRWCGAGRKETLLGGNWEEEMDQIIYSIGEERGRERKKEEESRRKRKEEERGRKRKKEEEKKRRKKEEGGRNIKKDEERGRRKEEEI